MSSGHYRNSLELSMETESQDQILSSKSKWFSKVTRCGIFLNIFTVYVKEWKFLVEHCLCSRISLQISGSVYWFTDLGQTI